MKKPLPDTPEEWKDVIIIWLLVMNMWCGLLTYHALKDAARRLQEPQVCEVSDPEFEAYKARRDFDRKFPHLKQEK